jgi:hypothetical protein
MAFSNESLLVDYPVQVFWTPFDPLDLASGSLDPLGFARGYLSLADRFLPSFTTVTTVPRYVSMLCAAIRAAQSHYHHEPGTAAARGRAERLRLIKSFERAWAIACGLAAQDPSIGRGAVQGLRGVSYVNQRLGSLSGRERYLQTGDFPLLSNQVRYGGIGIYATLLEECHLGSVQGFTLRPLGEELADAFPAPPPGTPAHDEDARLSLEALREWGSRAHVGAFTHGEGAVLTEALRGGEEADWPDHVRWATLRMLAALNLQPDDDEADVLRTLSQRLGDGKFDHLGAPVACLKQIRATLHVLEPFEQFYQGLLFLFEQVRGAASDEAEAHLTDLASAERVGEAGRAIRQSAEQLGSSLRIASEVDAATSGEVETVLRESGVLALADEVQRETAGDVGLMRVVLRRHGFVQSGKFDKGLAKAAWVRLAGTDDDTVGLTAQRYQLPLSQRPEGWADVGRHPYRTSSALAFIRACNIG